jgi:regulatory protein
MEKTYDYQRAYSYTVKLLTGRDYSEKKLKEKLYQKKVSKDIIEKVLGEIKEKGFLREESYAEARIKAFMNKGYAKKYILQKISLEAQGVELETIDEIFAEYRMTEEEQVHKLVYKKRPENLPSEFEDKRKLFQKILRFVVSKGHSPSLAFKQIKLSFSQNKSFEFEDIDQESLSL